MGRRDKSFRTGVGGGGGRGGSHRGNRGRGAFRGRQHGGKAQGAAGPHQNKKVPQFVGPRLLEADVGITEFTSKHEGFTAVLKHRYSDFHVNEIDLEGNVVKLTSLMVPKEVEVSVKVERHELIPEDIWGKLSSLVQNKNRYGGAKQSSKNTAPLKPDSQKESEKPIKEEVIIKSEESPNAPPNMPVKSEAISSSSDVEKSKEITGPEEKPSMPPLPGKSDAIPTSGNNQGNVKDAPQCVELDVTSFSKDGRRAVHECVKKAFKDLNGNTIERDGKKFIVFSLGKGNDKRNRGKWPECRDGEYLYFVVHKQNTDTTEAVNHISGRLGLRTNSITFAGTKDKRGISSQLMSIRRMEPSRLYSVSQGLKGTFLGNYCFKPKPIRLGDLKGNQFRIALRNVECSNDQINAALESLKNNGFINYYGLQRFGTNKHVPTYSIGKALLLSDWKKVADLILAPRENVQENIKAALMEWQISKDANAALRKLGRPTNCLEELLLKGIQKRGPNDIVGALSMVPTNTQLMYVHAYQSLIWNKTVSERIKEYGLQVIPGDLVIVKSDKFEGLDNIEDESTVGTEDSPLDDTVIDGLVGERGTKHDVRCVTEENLKNYKIEDVVLPLPGYDVLYPSNAIGSFMKDLLKEDGLTPESFQHQVKKFALRGAYRHIFSRVENLSWKIVHYEDPESDLILSDYDEIMKGKTLSVDETDGKYKAIVVTMCLGLSTYATMALREVTKTDTSAATQVSISAAAAKEEKENEEVDMDSTVGDDVKGDMNEDAVAPDVAMEVVQSGSDSKVKRKATESSDEVVLPKKTKKNKAMA